MIFDVFRESYTFVGKPTLKKNAIGYPAIWNFQLIPRLYMLTGHYCVHLYPASYPAILKLDPSLAPLPLLCAPVSRVEDWGTQQESELLSGNIAAAVEPTVPSSVKQIHI